MAKRFKLKFPRVITSFQFCRSNSLSTLPAINPSPAIHRLSPVNPKAIDIVHSNLQAPPSTPEQHSPYKRHVSSNIVSVGCGCRSSRSCTQYCSNTGSSTPPPDSSSSSSRSFSNEWFNELMNESEKCREKEKSDNSVKKSRRVRKYGLKSSECKRVHGNNNKVKESYAVVKRTEDPYEDFKRSMLEMILEKQMFETKDLEELLHCFLSLNSRMYHGIIVEAFSEIWEVLFSDSTVDQQASLGV
jgi:uncharacterized protein (TIGR01568 family)